ncbi:phosphate ABC transporter substrate-binding protein [Chromobacterium violaceum]|uniref:phosphate/phosphite/phosphonate ABC transporter substrate-binding protein n=1 Tax=Chromobacterium violaceum TaxID=536 RepID=UPI0009DA1EFD|nr:phosphate/phosphite/phosphonate ABC transporter substrate-binding protein [Chromobacterium violaceum]ATP28453.1 phosphate ABC transporter substrate-binding protein [Chromobacterium violaceum]ATP32363.1 phosphate ABC transporter substrate-binding protein [Chromobacterium violaceum]MBP4050093.1 phosphate/phosphite/phosphonate ABC transporter substrate-binding protein [Chromobacterium violaceum]OQS28139.1 phosphate ABC transporter substrate-binding protein [Chromobacterium violaceum]
MNTKPLNRLASWIFLALACAAAPAPRAAPLLRVGVVPQQSALSLAQAWGPLLQYLGAQCAMELRFETAPDIPAFEQRVAAGSYDLVYVNPLHYVQFHEKPGYLPLAREKDRKLVGLIVVRGDSPVTEVRQLEGMDLALPAPEAFAASVLPRIELENMGVRARIHYVGSHDSVYLGVAQGLFAAGGGINRTWQQQPEALRGKLRILWQTPPYTPHAFAAHPRLPAAQKRCLQRELVGLSEQPEGQRLLRQLQLTPLTEAQDSDWNDIRRLKLRYQPPVER